MFDLIALWVGRVALGIIGIIAICLLAYSTRILFRRPYYCIKHLLPWKRWNDTEWQETVDKVNQRHFDTESKEWMNRIKMYQFGKHLGCIRDYGNHFWWEPTYRFFWIRG